jgi:DNA modification methylase
MEKRVNLLLGDCLVLLKDLEDNSVDSIVTDPPAGIAFMSAKWDSDKGGRDYWIEWMTEVSKECLRVIKPGGHALVWSLPRTSHWTATAWENAGWELKDRIAHVFGSGFPKGQNIGKAIDKLKGAEREVIGKLTAPCGCKDGTNALGGSCCQEPPITAPATPEAAQWDGWNTALKPAVEDWWLMRKPFKGTIAANVLEHGTGAINIDGCRVKAADSSTTARVPAVVLDTPTGFGKGAAMGGNGSNLGRYPANLIHDGSDEVLKCFPETQTNNHGKVLYEGVKDVSAYNGSNTYGKYNKIEYNQDHSGKGSAARFFKALPDDDPEDEATRLFYCAKAAKKDRGETNRHPTVKATKLMSYLCRLITPPGGIILDPFMGSGSTGKAALLEGFNFIGIEQDPEYFEIAMARINHVLEQDTQLKLDL